MSIIYHYDKRGREALVELVKTIYPRLGVQSHTVAFEEPIHVPTTDEPGRTYIEMELFDRGVKLPFYYRRLDLAISMGDPVRINLPVGSDVTPRIIAETINTRLGFSLNSRDVDFSRTLIRTERNPLIYTLKAKPGSYVWYGETTVEVKLSHITGHERLLEDGSFRLMESNEKAYRQLETAPIP